MSDFLPSLFKGLPEVDVNRALALFKTVEVGPGFHLIEEGDVDSSLVVVQRGELQILTGDTKLGRAGDGDLIGEIALFSSGMRTATVRSVTACTLWILDIESYEVLRNESNAVALAIEEHALNLLTDRLRSVGDRIASLAHGESRDNYVPAAGFFDRVASAFGSGGVMSPGWVNGVQVLSRSPLFAHVPEEILQAVASHFVPTAARRGHFLCTEGTQADEMYIIASGSVDVVVATQGNRVQHLASLAAGDAFGMCALLQTENPRMASCIARENTVLLALGQIKWAELIGYADLVGSVLRVAIIRALSDQLSYANAQLAMLDMQRARNENVERSRETVMRAAVAMESHGTYMHAEDDRPSYLE